MSSCPTKTLPTSSGTSTSQKNERNYSLNILKSIRKSETIKAGITKHRNQAVPSVINNPSAFLNQKKIKNQTKTNTKVSGIPSAADRRRYIIRYTVAKKCNDTTCHVCEHLLNIFHARVAYTLCMENRSQPGFQHSIMKCMSFLTIKSSLQL